MNKMQLMITLQKTYKLEANVTGMTTAKINNFFKLEKTNMRTKYNEKNFLLISRTQQTKHVL